MTGEGLMISDAPSTLRHPGVTGQMRFDSHVFALISTSVRLVNALSAGSDGGRPIRRPQGGALVEAGGGALDGQGGGPRGGPGGAGRLGGGGGEGGPGLGAGGGGGP